MKKKLITLILTLSLILSLSAAVGAAELDSVNYILSGDSFDVDAIQIEPEFLLDSGHSIKTNFAFDGDDFYLGADMGINLFREEEFKLDLHLMVTNDVDGQSFGKAIGASARTLNPDVNFYWHTYYFIDSDLDNHAYYRGGVDYPISDTVNLDVSVGNFYWDLDSTVLNLGLKFKL
ncbi:hypothetical protein [Halanaerobium hydrogeniformans]|uniref:Outer membrane protein beta-barrel domain-containing protein n=1 Tax=Halanaerobium hydrogeniformans TaxID=656519 RepID=E4RPP3_HALHG|nr:hypothetical protein [Halanaerobium hydrogeniformans]ADQ13927.1 hypothetical protein Halsa_0454 [Halanaerobium hydrogeniformans]